MTKQKVIEELCSLSADIGREVYHNKYSYDCFCGYNHKDDKHFQFNHIILDFIKQAVNEKIKRGDK